MMNAAQRIDSCCSVICIHADNLQRQQKKLRKVAHTIVNRFSTCNLCFMNHSYAECIVYAYLGLQAAEMFAEQFKVITTENGFDEKTEEEAKKILTELGNIRQAIEPVYPIAVIEFTKEKILPIVSQILKTAAKINKTVGKNLDIMHYVNNDLGAFENWLSLRPIKGLQILIQYNLPAMEKQHVVALFQKAKNPENQYPEEVVKGMALIEEAVETIKEYADCIDLQQLQS